MSKRKRHQEKGTVASQVEWLKHRTGYPSPEEREKIIQLRKELMSEIISLLVSHVEGNDPRLRELINRYGEAEIARAETAVSDGLDLPSRVAGDAKSYRDYRLRYSRFGAGLPFYTAGELDTLFEKYADSFKGFDEHADTTEATGMEVEKLLLMDWREWEDITPPAIPPRPDNYNVALPKTYPAPVDKLLAWGNDLAKHYDFFANEQEYLQWKKSIPALTRMALDPGLLNGWPSESASWAPWHAIHVLGNLQAWESAPALAELTDFQNDWLSDHLPHIWADMDIEVEPMLWMVIEDRSASEKRRGLAAESLYMLTEDNEAIYNKVVRGFAKILQNAETFNPTLNGYLVLFLHSMEAVDVVSAVIHEAFEHNRVDLDIITPEDLEEDDLGDNEFADEEADH